MAKRKYLSDGSLATHNKIVVVMEGKTNGHPGLTITRIIYTQLEDIREKYVICESNDYLLKGRKKGWRLHIGSENKYLTELVSDLRAANETEKKWFWAKKFAIEELKKRTKHSIRNAAFIIRRKTGFSQSHSLKLARRLRDKLEIY